MDILQPPAKRHNTLATMLGLAQRQPACASQERYVLTLSTTPELMIHDRHTRIPTQCWGADILRYLVTTGALPRQYHRFGTYPCNKELVWHLLLAATAAEMSLNQLNASPQETRNSNDRHKNY